MKEFFDPLQKDNELFVAIEKERIRQNDHIELIASENYVSKAVMQAQGSILTNKYAEGYPHKRYYGGCEFVDIVEDLAIERLKKLFSVNFVNVQAHSGSQANQAVFTSILKPGDTILGMDLSAGGHLTHGAKVNLSGKYYQAFTYGVNEKGLIDLNEVEELAKKHQPKLIIAGGSAYSRFIDWQGFSQIAKQVGAYFLTDIAHYSGLIAAGVYPSSIGIADFITSTTHKTLRGPRGGIVMTNNEEYSKRINSAIFPGLQGGPLMHVIAAKAVCFKEADTLEFKQYALQVIKNSKYMAEVFQSNGFRIVSGGTDCHLFLVDLSSKNLTGAFAQELLDSVGITVNKNSIPSDPQKPTITSGIRIGTPALTTRGFKEAEVGAIAQLICDLLIESSEANQQKVKKKIHSISSEFPLYQSCY